MKLGRYLSELYSCLFWSPEKYRYMSTSKRYYYQPGRHETDVTSTNEWPHAMLVFDVKTDELVYAKECPALAGINPYDTDAINQCFKEEEKKILPWITRR